MTLVVSQSDYPLLRVTGGDRVRFLQGLTTVNVETLGVGAQTWGAILSPKGRLLSIFEMGKTAEDIWLLCEPSLGEATRALLEKYAVMDDVVFTPDDRPKHRVWTSPAAAWHAPIVFGPASAPASSELVHAWRVAAGIPSYGVDVSDAHLPFETPLANFLDYQKGCYVGQEPVFRVHAQGKPQKQLCGLRLTGAQLPLLGANVSHASRPSAGTVTSVATSPELGLIALAMLHRSCLEPEAQLFVDDAPARLAPLPFV
ncbi:MAG: folate-binding protein YgfZ [Myxococcales bacterium]|nr:folate-binding protein YgfZ [Myxococcales bacterium]